MLLFCVLSDDIAFKFGLLYRNTENFRGLVYGQFVSPVKVNHCETYVQFSLRFDFTIMSREFF